MSVVPSKKQITTVALLVTVLSIQVMAQPCLEPSPNNPDVCCTFLGRDDNPPDKCLNGDDTTLTFAVNGICNTNFDCCLCTEIRVTEARSHTCGGDQSCIGVPIIIEGDELGSVLNCNGDLSCQFSNITGENMLGIKCDGDRACENTFMDINLNIAADTSLAGIIFPCNGDGTCRNSIINAKNVGATFCNGDESCSDSYFDFDCRTNGFDTGCPFVLGGDDSFVGSTAFINHCTEIRCGGDQACNNTRQSIECVPRGCIFNCGGDNACSFSTLDYKNIQRIECVGPASCQHLDITSECLLPFGCPVICSGAFGACQDSVFSVTNSAGLNCGGGTMDNCRDSTFSLIDNIGGNIDCLGTSKCFGATINGGYNELGQPIPVKNVNSFTCSGLQSCKMANIDAECNEDVGCICNCIGDSACANDGTLSMDLMNVKAFSCSTALPGAAACTGDINLGAFDESFQIICGSQDACNGAEYSIETGILSKIIGVACSGTSSCADANFEISSANDFVIESFLCNGAASCQRMILDYEGDMSNIGLRMACENANSCMGTEIYAKGLSVDLLIECKGLMGCNDMIVEFDADSANIEVTCTTSNFLSTCEGAILRNLREGTEQPILESISITYQA